MQHFQQVLWQASEVRVRQRADIVMALEMLNGAGDERQVHYTSGGSVGNSFILGRILGWE